ncbi:MAG: hypothetical protein V4675_17385 [Verrucomicrobiota bacterium]
MTTNQPGMPKLYKTTGTTNQYWETWEHRGVHTIHWGELGTKGQSKEIKSGFFKRAKSIVRKEMDEHIQAGYAAIDPENHFTLMIEYSVDGMGSADDVDKRTRLQGLMDETLGWTGLGHCDGGSIGSGTMEVCCFVIDFDLAKMVVAESLAGTEFENHTRLYEENADQGSQPGV